jgi:hypothetical protein
MIMKTITLLVASAVLFGTTANATVISHNTVEVNNRFDANEPISFIERGIEFLVFPNGDFDFNTRPQDTQGAYYYKKAGNTTGTSTARRAQNYGVIIEHDSFGRVRRVGNTFINYDNRDRVNRIGSVFMKYNRRTLIQIGGMALVYNRRGDLIDTIGSIKGFTYGYAYSYNNNHYNHCDDDEDYSSNTYNNSNSNDYYYYKSDGSKARVEDN